MSENREARIAELEREIERIKAMPWSVPSDKRSERFMAISYELARLRNEVTSAALAQSDAEPVGWREALDQQLFDLVELARDRRDASQISESEWLHPRGALVNEFSKRISAPDRPDASVGLIEAAEIAEEWDSGWGEDRNTKVARQTAIEIAAAIRSRAADRSGK